MQNAVKVSRNIGLDVARSTAIIFVLIAHFSMFFSTKTNISPILHGFGFFGVELFFVLSGLLIGRILIRDLLYNHSFQALLSFWKRRWYRTLPAYYLIWSILFFRSGSDPNNLVHLFMLQNFFYGPRDLFFGVSWSLAAEEWFYLLAPLLMYTILKFKITNPRKLMINMCFIGILLAPVLRLIFALLFDQHEHWGDIRKSSFIRLDAFLFGILIATIQSYYPYVFTFINKHKYFFLSLSAVGLGLCSTQFRNMENIATIFNKTILFTLTDFFIALVLILFDSSNLFSKWRNSWKEKVVFFISITSYSVYLIHWDIMIKFMSYKVGTASLGLITVLLLLCTCTTYIVASFIYMFWERPFLAIRDNNYVIKNILTFNRTLIDKNSTP